MTIGGANFNMVTNFTILRNFCLKTVLFSCSRSFRVSHRILSCVSYRQVMNQFAVRNIEGEERLQMCFNFCFNEKSRVYNLDRAKSEALNLTLIRLAANVEKHIFKKKKKKSKKGTEAAAANDDEEVEVNSHVEVYLVRDGSKIPDDTVNEAAWTDGTHVHINGSTYTVRVNQPSIKTLSLPTCLMSDFPTYPKISSEFCTDYEIKWYRGTPKQGFDCTKNVYAHNIDAWSELCEGNQYTPSNEDIGQALKIECIPKKSDVIGFIKEAIGEKVVEAGPGFCPFENRHVFTKEHAASDCVRVVSYNILADIYADSDFSRQNLFPLCPPYALNIDYRIRLLQKEIKGYHSDIICLQEVDRKVFEHELLPILSQLGYGGYQKEKAGEMPEGSAIFYRREKFRLVSQHDIIVTDSLRGEEYNRDIWNKVRSCDKLQKRVLERTTCFQVALLESLTQPGRHVLVGTTHLYFRPNACHIRVIQGVVCIRHMENLITKFKEEGLNVAPIFCGDLNWVKPDGLIFYLINNEISKNDRSWMSSGEEEYFGGLDLSHNLQLISACGFPDYTNYVVGFQACLDYIMSDKSQFTVDQVIPMPSHEEVTLHEALPNIVFPSDHIALVCDLKWKPSIESV